MAVNDYFRKQTEGDALSKLPASLREAAQVKVDVTTLIPCNGHNCKKQFNALEGENFYTIHGNVMMGLNGGLIGNNLSGSGYVERVIVMCPECMMRALMLKIEDLDNAYKDSVNLGLNLIRRFQETYRKTMESGDCGNWDPEDDSEYNGLLAAIEILEAL